jgi:2-C-methyl-D-erythritol 4-phosphate cytidylyltransferase
VPVAAVPGERLNLKLTTPDDWLLARALHAQLQS